MYYDELMPTVRNLHAAQSDQNDYFIFTYSLATIVGCEAAIVLSKIECWINVSGKDLIGEKVNGYATPMKAGKNNFQI